MNRIDLLASVNPGDIGVHPRFAATPDFHWIATVARAELWILIAALLAVVAGKLLTGRINSAAMLCEKPPQGELSLSPARVQLLLITLVTACLIPLSLSQMREAHTLQVASNLSVLLLGGSNTIYLLGRFLK